MEKNLRFARKSKMTQKDLYFKGIGAQIKQAFQGREEEKCEQAAGYFQGGK
jgi:hypothetical protein